MACRVEACNHDESFALRFGRDVSGDDTSEPVEAEGLSAVIVCKPFGACNSVRMSGSNDVESAGRQGATKRDIFWGGPIRAKRACMEQSYGKRHAAFFHQRERLIGATGRRRLNSGNGSGCKLTRSLCRSPEPDAKIARPLPNKNFRRISNCSPGSQRHELASEERFTRSLNARRTEIVRVIVCETHPSTSDHGQIIDNFAIGPNNLTDSIQRPRL